MKVVGPMPYNTDKQVKEHEALARLDQVDRIMDILESVNDLEEAKEECRAIKKALRAKADEAL